jgi:hypothetical protein
MIIPDAIVKVGLLDVNIVSDSTRVMHPALKTGDGKKFYLEMEKQREHANVTAKQDTQGASSQEALGAGHKGPFESVLAGSALHCTWNLNECFIGKQRLIGDTCADWLLTGVKLLMEAVAVGEAAKAHFPRAIFIAGGSGEEWSTNELFDFYASCARVGLVSTGHCVHGQVRL